jgi:hypothetical protein
MIPEIALRSLARASIGVFVFVGAFDLRAYNGCSSVIQAKNIAG